MGTWDTISTTDVDSEDRFAALVARMQDHYPEITAENVVVEYGYSGSAIRRPVRSGHGSAGHGAAHGMSFEPSLGFLFGGSLGMPAFAATLTNGRWRGTPRELKG